MRRAITDLETDPEFAAFAADFVRKVEAEAVRRYPVNQAGWPMHGKLWVVTSLSADGSVEDIRVTVSSGDPELDAAAVALVRRAGPFRAFSSEMKRVADLIEIRRAFSFKPAANATP